jgi:hypothetical protein
LLCAEERLQHLTCLPLAEVAIQVLVCSPCWISQTSTVQCLSLANFDSQILGQEILRTNLCVWKVGNLSRLIMDCKTRSWDTASSVFTQALEFKGAFYLLGERSYCFH